MKPRNLEINIFNLSMLDVISGAMGEFLIVMVILLPYYRKETIDYRRELQQFRAAEVTARTAAEAAEAAQRAAEEPVRKLAQAAKAAQRAAEETHAKPKNRCMPLKSMRNRAGSVPMPRLNISPRHFFWCISCGTLKPRM